MNSQTSSKATLLWIKEMLHNDKVQEFVRFCIVGVIAAAIHYGVYWLIQQAAEGSFWLRMAYSVAYVVSLVCNFFMTTYFTFRSDVSAKKAAGFGGSHLVNYVLHIALFNLFIAIGVHRLLAPLLVLSIAVPVNFTLLHFVFKGKKG